MDTQFVLINNNSMSQIDEFENMSKDDMIKEILQLRYKISILENRHNEKFNDIIKNTQDIMSFLKNNRKIYTTALDAVKEQEQIHQKELNKILNPIDFSLRMNNGFWRLRKPNGSQRKRSDSFSQQLINDIMSSNHQSDCKNRSQSDNDSLSQISDDSNTLSVEN